MKWLDGHYKATRVLLQDRSTSKNRAYRKLTTIKGLVHEKEGELEIKGTVIKCENPTEFSGCLHNLSAEEANTYFLKVSFFQNTRRLKKSRNPRTPNDFLVGTDNLYHRDINIMTTRVHKIQIYIYRVIHEVSRHLVRAFLR
jgi:hypothetical protein